jgi:hypothetical protein
MFETFERISKLSLDLDKKKMHMFGPLAKIGTIANDRITLFFGCDIFEIFIENGFLRLAFHCFDERIQDICLCNSF